MPDSRALSKLSDHFKSIHTPVSVRGGGSELAGHMKALHSSSALVANFFDYWTDRDSTPLLAALETDAGKAESLNFEARFPTGLGGTPPHLDVEIVLNSGTIIGVERKFAEHLERSTTGKSKFKPSYFARSGGLWTSAGLPECQSLAEELHDRTRRFEFPRKLRNSEPCF